MSAGHQVVATDDGRKALDLLRAGSLPGPDLIVLDPRVSVDSDPEFGAPARKADPTLSDIPIMTASVAATVQAGVLEASLGNVMRILGERDRQTVRDRLEHTQRLAALGTLAAGLGHEIANPLSVVLSNLELAEQTLDAVNESFAALTATPRAPGDAEAERGIGSALADAVAMVHDAREASGRFRALFENLRRFGRTGEEPRRPLQVRDVLERALQMCVAGVRNRARVLTDFQPAPDVMGDESRLAQVFLNLVSNAAQAMPPGGAADNEIRVRVRTQAGRVIVEVEDTGPGMPAEVQRRLFEPFFTTKPPDEGAGLGLSVCRAIVQAHGGAITIDSEPGRGTICRLSLPGLPAGPI